MRRPRHAFHAATALTCALCLGCGGNDLNLGTDDRLFPDANTPPCQAPDGPEIPYVDKPTLLATLAGRWLLCEVDIDVGQPTVAAVEFTDDGFWYPLLAGFVRGPQGTYEAGKDISTSTDAGVVWVCMPDGGSDPHSCPDVVVRFHRGPLRMLWSESGAGPTTARYAKD